MRIDETLVDQLRSLSKIEDRKIVREELAGVLPEDLAEAVSRLDTEEGVRLLQKMEENQAAGVLVELPTETARSLISELPDALLAHYLDILPMDDALALKDELPEERFHALLNVIPHEDAMEIRRLLAFPEGSAGQMMTEDFMEVLPSATIRDVLRHIREAPDEEYETVNNIYVVDEHRHLLGVMSLKEAVRAQPDTPVQDVMSPECVTAPATAKAEEVARTIAKYGLYSMPLLDERGRILGIITVDDAQTVLSDADTEDVLKLGGVSGDVESYLSLSIPQLVKRRLPWLMALFIAEMFTGQVLRYYGQSHDDLRMNPLVFFIPLLIGAGGNSGSQVTTTITRSLALGEITSRDWVTVIRREFSTAVIIGTLLGIVGFIRAFSFQPLGWHQPMPLSLTVALTLPAIVIWATVVGSLLPIGAKKVGIDPAVMSAPFITTFVDATGLVIYFEIARALLI